MSQDEQHIEWTSSDEISDSDDDLSRSEDEDNRPLTSDDDDPSPSDNLDEGFTKLLIDDTPKTSAEISVLCWNTGCPGRAGTVCSKERKEAINSLFQERTWNFICIQECISKMSQLLPDDKKLWEIVRSGTAKEARLIGDPATGIKEWNILPKEDDTKCPIGQELNWRFCSYLYRMFTQRSAAGYIIDKNASIRTAIVSLHCYHSGPKKGGLSQDEKLLLIRQFLCILMDKHAQQAQEMNCIAGTVIVAADWNMKMEKMENHFLNRTDINFTWNLHYSSKKKIDGFFQIWPKTFKSSRTAATIRDHKTFIDNLESIKLAKSNRTKDGKPMVPFDHSPVSCYLSLLPSMPNTIDGSAVGSTAIVHPPS